MEEGDSKKEVDMRKQIMLIHNDASLSAAEKGQRTQALMSGQWKKDTSGDKADGAEGDCLSVSFCQKLVSL